MAATPEVTVVIPAHNRWSLLSTTLASALAQEDVDFEVIVVDDGSTDETPARLAEIDDPRLTVLTHEQSRGVSPARDWAISVARGEWIAFLDSDDLWSPRMLRTKLDAARGTDASFVYAASVVLDTQTSAVRPDAGVPRPEELSARLLVGNAIPGGASNVLATADAVRRAGNFDDRLMMLSDWDYWLKLADVGNGLACQEVLVAYRLHPRNLTVTDLEHIDRELDYFAAKHQADRGMDLDRVAYSRWLAGEARGARQAARIYMRTGVKYRSPGNIARAAIAPLGAWRLARAVRRAREGRAVEPEWLRAYR